MIKSIRFSLLSDEVISKLSVVDVDEGSIQSKNLPKDGGPNDLRLGSSLRSYMCNTCMKNSTDCVGHYGRIKFPIPFFHPLVTQFTIRILRSVCYWCSEHLNGKKICRSCGGAQPQYFREKVGCISATFKQIPEEERPTSFTSKKALQILENIPSEAKLILGCKHPERLIMRSLIVPPVCIRPSVRAYKGSRQLGHDFLTVKLSEIVKSTKLLRESIEKNHEKNISKYYQLTMENILSYMDKDLPNSKRRFTSMINKSLSVRLRGKKGRIRANIMGKRVNYSSRTVICPESFLDIDQVVIPKIFAQEQEYPTVVQPYNKDHLRTLILEGKVNSLTRGRKTYKLKNAAHHVRKITAEKLQNNDKIQRQLLDNDLVIMNRQPTLALGSMMGHRVKILDGDDHVLRLPLACTSAYNADFDGDEMNTHCMQTPGSIVEVATLMNVGSHILNYGTHSAQIFVVQDSVIGSYLLSNAYLSEKTFNFLACRCKSRYKQLPDSRNTKLSGKQIVSFILPENFNYTGGGITIRNGLFEKGTLEKGALKKITYRIAKYYGGESAVLFLSDLQRITCAYLSIYGYTIDASDIYPSTVTQKTIKNVIDSRGEDLSTILPSIGNVLMKTDDLKTNHLYQLVDSGSKGNSINLCQIMGCVSSQSLNNEVMDRGVGRTLACYNHGTKSDISFGFCSKPFNTGLPVDQFFFHAMSGRCGIIDTSCRTALCGYIQRRMVKFMENLTIADNSKVIDFQQTIQERFYGSGINPQFVESVDIPELQMTDQDITKKHGENAEEVIRLRNVLIKNAKVYSDSSPTALQTILNIPYLLTFCSDDPPTLPTSSLDSEIESLMGTCSDVTKMVVRSYLPRGLTEETREIICTQMYNCMIEKNTNIGIISAVSIASPITQQTLNSVDYETYLVIRTRSGRRSWTGSIGSVIDELMSESQPQRYPNDTLYLPLPKGFAEALTLDDEGNVSWKELEAVTKHPPINKDGSNTLLKVTTESGRTVTATKAKSFLVVEGTMVVEKNGDNLNVGDQIPVVGILPKCTKKEIEIEGIGKIRLSREFGFSIGTYLAKGSVVRPDSISKYMIEWCGHESQRRVPPFAWDAPIVFIKGIFEAFFGTNQESSSDSKALIEGMALLLTRCNIHAQLSVSENVYTIRLVTAEKPVYLNDVFLDPIVSIEEVPSSHPYVYDLTVADTRNMITESGLAQKDTFHFAGVSTKVNVTMGLSRAKELIDIAKNPKTTTIEFKTTQKFSKEVMEFIVKDLREVTLGDTILYSKIVEEPPNGEEWELHRDICGEWKGKKKKFLNLCIEMGIRKEFKTSDIAYTVESCLNFCTVHFTNSCIYILLAIPRKSLLKTRNASISQEILELIRMKITNNLSHIHFSGVHGVNQTEYENQSVKIAGCDDMKNVFLVPFVDPSKVYSNNVNLMYKFYGVEASVICLYKEFIRLIEFDGGYIHPSHVMLLVDSILRNGKANPVSRHGLKKIKLENVIHRASFEVTTHTFLEAAVSERVDRLQGNSEMILCGNSIKTGTGGVKLVKQKNCKKKKRTKRKVEDNENNPHWDYTIDPRIKLAKVRKRMRMEKKHKNKAEFCPQSPIMKYNFPEFQDVSPSH